MALRQYPPDFQLLANHKSPQLTYNFQFARERIIGAVQDELNESQFLELEGAVSHCNEFDEIFKVAGQYFDHLACDDLYFFIDDRLYKADINVEFPTVGYDWTHIRMVYAMNDMINNKISGINELIEFFENDGNGSYYLFTPIHFEDKVIGFSVLKESMLGMVLSKV